MHSLKTHALNRTAELVAEAGTLLTALASDSNSPLAIQEAAPQAIALLFGAPLDAIRNPVARRLASGGITHVMAQIGRDDLGAAFRAGVNILVATQYAKVADYLRLCKSIELPDEKPYTTTAIDQLFDDPKFDVPMKEHEEAPDLYVKGYDGEIIALSRRSFAVRFSQEMLKDDTIGASGHVLQSFVILAARREQRAFFSKIVANPTLVDGRAVFNSTDDNDLGPAATLSLTTLGDGFGKMARMKSKVGNELGTVPAFLVVSPEKKVLAMSLVKQLTIDGTPASLDVLVSTEIPAASTGWYLFADPEIAPVGVFGTLRFNKGRTLIVRERIDFRTSSPMVAFDHVFGTAVVSRVGVVRGGV